jgi:DNA/RNA-binding domain of Phe-tRNA-synthetase-like protein
MAIKINSTIFEKVPTFKIGVINYHNIQVGESPQMLKGRFQLFQESIYFDMVDTSVTELEGISEWRKTFKLLGKDPNRYRHSAEALYRRVQKQNYLSSVQSAIDVNNFFSLRYQVPIGIYDTDKISGDVTMRLGNESEEYEGLNGRMNSLNQLLVTSDELGPFGSPFVDSARTATGSETKNAIQIIYLKPSTVREEAEKLTESLMNMFIQIHGGEGNYLIVGA